MVWVLRTATPPLIAATSIEKALQHASGLPAGIGSHWNSASRVP
jgi:hypothetical protein